MSIKKLMISSVALLALGFGATIAEAKKAPKAPKDPNAVTAPKKSAKPHSEKSVACSAEATAKGLHGKARKAFRKECMKKAA